MPLEGGPDSKTNQSLEVSAKERSVDSNNDKDYRNIQKLNADRMSEKEQHIKNQEVVEAEILLDRAYDKSEEVSHSIITGDQPKPTSLTLNALSVSNDVEIEDGETTRYRAFESGIQFEKDIGKYTKVEAGLMMGLTQYEKELLESKLQQNDQIKATNYRCASANAALNTGDWQFFAGYGMAFHNGKWDEKIITVGGANIGKKFTTFLQGEVDIVREENPIYDIQGGIEVDANATLRGKVAIGYSSDTGFYPQIGITKSL